MRKLIVPTLIAASLLATACSGTDTVVVANTYIATSEPRIDNGVCWVNARRADDPDGGVSARDFPRNLDSDIVRGETDEPLAGFMMCSALHEGQSFTDADIVRR